MGIENHPKDDRKGFSPRDEQLIELVEGRLAGASDERQIDINTLIASLYNIAVTDKSREEGSSELLQAEARMWSLLRDLGAKTPDAGLEIIQAGRVPPDRILEWLRNGALHSGDSLVAAYHGYSQDAEIQKMVVDVIVMLKLPGSERGQTME